MSFEEFIHSAVKNGKQITLLKNDFLKLGGTTDTNIYFVESGSLCVFVMDEDEEQIIRFGYNNDLIVSLDSFLTEQASDFYIQAIKKSKIRVIPKQQFIDFVNESGENQQMWISMLEELVLPQLFQEIPNKFIANYLRITPETLSRLKKS